jgi:hypothetical protein
MTTKKNKRNNKMVNKKENKTRKSTSIYSKKEFSSGDGMLTTVWGPSLWHSLHTISFNYPNCPTKEDKKNYKDFILNLKNVIPCKYCRINLGNNFKSLPLKNSDMKNRETFSKYIFNLHELVNKMLKKKSNLTYNEVRIRYEHFRARCNTIPIKPLWNKETITKNVKATLKITSKQDKTRKNTHEKGCTEPMYKGSKSKCIIKIVPQDAGGETFQMDKKCEKKKLTLG